jgi:hypothetical protein
MFLLLLAYFGGVLTILSPCILPVLPLVFARSDQPFRKSGLPLLAGMAAHPGVAPRKSGSGRFLDLFLHQLPAHPALYQGPGMRNTKTADW